MASTAFGIYAIQPGTGPHVFGFSGTPAGDVFEVWTTAAATGQILKANKNGDVILGPDAAPILLTTATGGFLYIRACAGAPTGVPANYIAGHAVFAYDSTNNKLYVYDGSWLSTGALT